MGKQTKEGFVNDLIILRSVYGKVGQKYYIQPCKDNKTGRLPDCVKPVNSQGDIILSDKERNSGEYFIKENETFIVEDGTVFDLSDEIQRKNWEAIKNCSLIAPDFNAKDSDGHYLIHGTANMKTTRPRYGVAELFIDKPGLDSANRVSKKKKIHNACAYILDDPRGSEGRLIMAKLLGKNMANMPDADVEDYLLGVAEKDPDRIVKLYTGDDLALRLLFTEAREKKVILVKNGVYLYLDVVLGATDDAALTWMKDAKNKKTLELIRRDVFPENYMTEKS
jgi:hypothetical protein